MSGLKVVLSPLENDKKTENYTKLNCKTIIVYSNIS